MTDMESGILDRVRGESWGTRTSAPARVLEAVRHWLPQGQLLPEHIWRRRHQTIVYLMWFHVVFLTTFGLIQ
ncbi:MAG TPA: hypothetical protein VFZ89_20095, partial [Solirubrobacteraceae bacterium]